MVRPCLTLFLLCFGAAALGAQVPVSPAPAKAVVAGKTEGKDTPETGEKPEIDGAGDYPSGTGSRLFFWLKGEVVDFTPPSSPETRWTLLGGQVKEDPAAAQKKKEKKSLDEKKKPPVAQDPKAQAPRDQKNNPVDQKKDPKKVTEKEPSVWLFWGYKDDVQARSLWTCVARMDDKPVCQFAYQPLDNETPLKLSLGPRGELAVLLMNKDTFSPRVLVIRPGQAVRSWAFDPQIQIRDLALSADGRLALCGERDHPGQPFLWVDGERIGAPEGWRGMLTSLVWVPGTEGAPETLQAAGRGVPFQENDPEGKTVQTLFYDQDHWLVRSFAGVGFFPVSVYLVDDPEGKPAPVYWGMRADKPDGSPSFWMQTGDDPIEVPYPAGNFMLACWAFTPPRWALAFRNNTNGQYKLFIDSSDPVDAEGLPPQARLRVLILGSKDQK